MVTVVTIVTMVTMVTIVTITMVIRAAAGSPATVAVTHRIVLPGHWQRQSRRR